MSIPLKCYVDFFVQFQWVLSLEHKLLSPNHLKSHYKIWQTIGVISFSSPSLPKETFSLGVHTWLFVSVVVIDEAYWHLSVVQIHELQHPCIHWSSDIWKFICKWCFFPLTNSVSLQKKRKKWQKMAINKCIYIYITWILEMY